MRPAERVFLADPGNRKRLAREAAKQDVMSRHVVGGKRDDVADEGMAAAVVLQIGFLREFVPFAREDAFAALCLETHANAADAGEQVDELETRGGRSDAE